MLAAACHPAASSPAQPEATTSGVDEVLSSVCLPFVRDSLPEAVVARRAKLRPGSEQTGSLSGPFYIGQLYLAAAGVSRLRLNGDQVIPAPGLVSRALCSFTPQRKPDVWMTELADFMLREKFTSSPAPVEPLLGKAMSGLELACSSQQPRVWLATWAEGEETVVALGRAPAFSGLCVGAPE